MSDLKPCPFCGCQVTPRDRFNIKCEGCGVEMNALPHLLEAQWNARHLSDVPQGASVPTVDIEDTYQEFLRKPVLRDESWIFGKEDEKRGGNFFLAYGFHAGFVAHLQMAEEGMREEMASLKVSVASLRGALCELRRGQDEWKLLSRDTQDHIEAVINSTVNPYVTTRATADQGPKS